MTQNKAIMEQRGLKTGVHQGNQSTGLPSQTAPLHLANMESLLFTDCWREYQQRAGGLGGWGGGSASKAMAPLPMILSGLRELKHPKLWRWAMNRPAVTDWASGYSPNSTWSRPSICSNRQPLSSRTQSKVGATSHSYRIHSYACKQSRYSNSVIKCSTIQWDENRKQWPSTLNSSSLVHVSSSLTSPPSAAWACQACVLVCFFYPSLLGEGWGLLVRVGDPEWGGVGLEGF